MMTTMRRRMKRRRILTERPPPLILSSHLPLTVTCASSDQDVAAPPFVALADHHSLPCCFLRPMTEQRLRASTLPLPLTWCFVSFCDQRCCPSFFFLGLFFRCRGCCFSSRRAFFCVVFTFPSQWCDHTQPERRDKGHGGISGRFGLTHGPLLEGLL